MSGVAGAGFTPGFTPLLVAGRVEHVCDGNFIVKGIVGRGDRCAMGPTAVLRVDDRIHVLLATPVLVNTPGVGYYRPNQFEYQKARFWPEHDVSTPAITARHTGVI